VSESGSPILPPGFKERGASKVGSFSWTSPEGLTFTTSYTADENGFVATGDHLPVPPPIPADIQASLKALPQLVDIVEEQRFVRRRQHHDSAVVRTVVNAPLELVQAAAPERNFVQTDDFTIDYVPSKTIVRIGFINNN
jgi:hypothetical protein